MQNVFKKGLRHADNSFVEQKRQLIRHKMLKELRVQIVLNHLFSAVNTNWLGIVTSKPSLPNSI